MNRLEAQDPANHVETPCDPDFRAPWLSPAVDMKHENQMKL